MSRKKTADADHVFPMAMFDRRQAIIDLVLSVTFRFDGVLDTRKLRSALTRLSETGGWRKIGARARGSEWHIPRVFTENRPAFVFTSTAFGGQLVDHSVCSSLVHDPSTASGSTFPINRQLAQILFPAHTPNSTREWLTRDIPQLFVHTITFEDATLLSVRIPHIFADAVSLGLILKAWTCVLAGQLPPPILPLENACPTETLQRNTPAHDSVIYEQRTGMFTMACLGVDILVLGRIRPVEIRQLCISDRAVKWMHRDAKRVLAATPGETSHVTETDVLCAWLLHHSILAQGFSSKGRCTFGLPMDIRGVLGDVLDPGTACLGNVFDLTFMFSSGKKLARDPVAITAARLRRCLIAQRTRREMEARDTLVRKFASRTGIENASFGYWNQTFSCVSSWTKAGFYDLDFGPALRQSAANLEYGRCLPAFLHVDPDFYKSTPSPLMGYIRGKDNDGNWWLDWSLSPKAWPAIEKQMQNLCTSSLVSTKPEDRV